MGLAANQARLLTLTSRLSDLELKCQMYSNKKLVQSALAGNASIKYNNALEAANRLGGQVKTLISNSKESGSQGTGVTTLKMKNGNDYVNFNYSSLKTLGYDIAVPSSASTNGKEQWKMPTTIQEFGQLMLDMGCADAVNDSTINMTKYIDDEGNVVEKGNANSPRYWASKFAKNDIEVGTANTTTVEFDEAKLTALLGPRTTDDLAANVEAAKSDADALIEGLMQGYIAITKDGNEVGLADVGISEQEITTSYTYDATTTSQYLDYSERDAARDAAQKDYDAETNKLQAQDKVLDMLSKQAETEYSATSTEYESIKKLVGENAERSFSLFG